MCRQKLSNFRVNCGTSKSDYCDCEGKRWGKEKNNICFTLLLPFVAFSMYTVPWEGGVWVLGLSIDCFVFFLKQMLFFFFLVTFLTLTSFLYRKSVPTFIFTLFTSSIWMVLETFGLGHTKFSMQTIKREEELPQFSKESHDEHPHGEHSQSSLNSASTTSKPRLSEDDESKCVDPRSLIEKGMSVWTKMDTHRPWPGEVC